MTSWAVPMAPHPRVGEMGVAEVPDALLTSVKRGDLRALVVPNRWLRGAVHDAEGHLVVSSQKIGGLGGNQAVMADPARVPLRPGARRLHGTWLYGGHWIQHFGHFFTETVTTLWPDLAASVEGVVFHSYMSRFRGIQAWQTDLMALTAYAGLPVEIIEDKPLNVDRLLVPTRSVVVNGWAEPEAVGVWAQMTAAAGGAVSLSSSGPRLFFSRTAFNTGKRALGREVRTSPERDLALDAAFSDAGFLVVAPEALPVAEQIRLAAGASVLAGSAGTALHLSAFAPPGVRVLELGDDRSPTVQVPHQLVVDAAREHPSAFVPYDVAPEDLPSVFAGLGL
ncbi:MAG: glycosyltransferase family 61 protein [Nocardioides sp.]